jgi:hypothetical protein
MSQTATGTAAARWMGGTFDEHRGQVGGCVEVLSRSPMRRRAPDELPRRNEFHAAALE